MKKYLEMNNKNWLKLCKKKIKGRAAVNRP